jgi:hypothetical protein
MAATTTRGQVPLEIKFIDPQKPIKVGREIRFEVVRTDRPSERVPFDQLDFAFAPVLWGVVSAGGEAGTGVVKVVALAKSRDVYDRPKYEMSATYKARGDAALESGNLFALALAAPVVEVKFFVREEDPTIPEEYEPFDPQAQSQPLSSADFKVEPPHAAEVFEEAGRFFARIADPSLVGTLTVTFPNGEEATLRLDVRDAGKRPEELSREGGPGGGEEDEEAAETAPRGAAAAAAPRAASGSDSGERAALRAAASEEEAAADRAGEGWDAGHEDEAPRTPPAPAAPPGRESAPAPRMPSSAPAAALAAPAPAARAAAAAPASATAAPAPATSSGASGRIDPSRVDPSYGLRTAMTQLRREIDSAMSDGLIPIGARAKLLQKVKFFRDAAHGYKGPDKPSVEEFFERTLGSVDLGE